ncbi:WD40 repeat domain-containing protein [Kitasatospora aburaviensis]
MGRSPTALALSPDGTVLAVGTADGRLLTGPSDGTPLRARPLDPCGPVYAAVFLGDGADLAFACDSQHVHLLAAADPDARPRKSGIFHPDHLRHLAVSPDGRLLATAGNDRVVVVWDVRTGRSLGADPNRPAEPEEAARTVGSDTVHALAFAPDGRTLADVGQQGALRLWDLDSPAPAATLTGPGLPLNGLAFLPDGRVLTGVTAAPPRLEPRPGRCRRRGLCRRPSTPAAPRLAPPRPRRPYRPTCP